MHGALAQAPDDRLRTRSGDATARRFRFVRLVNPWPCPHPRGSNLRRGPRGTINPRKYRTAGRKTAIAAGSYDNSAGKITQLAKGQNSLKNATKKTIQIQPNQTNKQTPKTFHGSVSGGLAQINASLHSVSVFPTTGTTQPICHAVMFAAGS